MRLTAAPSGRSGSAGGSGRAPASCSPAAPRPSRTSSVASETVTVRMTTSSPASMTTVCGVWAAMATSASMGSSASSRGKGRTAMKVPVRTPAIGSASSRTRRAPAPASADRDVRSWASTRSRAARTSGASEDPGAPSTIRFASRCNWGGRLARRSISAQPDGRMSSISRMAAPIGHSGCWTRCGRRERPDGPDARGARRGHHPPPPPPPPAEPAPLLDADAVWGSTLPVVTRL